MRTATGNPGIVAGARWQRCAAAVRAFSKATGLRLLAVVLGIGVLAGCAGSIPETRYYLLSEPQDKILSTMSRSGTLAPAAADDATGLRLLAVRVPDYLQTRGLVVALDDSRIQAATYHQWAEPLVAGLERYLSDALAVALGAPDGFGPPALITVTLSHLHGSEAGTVVLDAEWQLLSAGDRSLLDGGRFERNLEQGEPGYPALVATHRRLLDALAAAIVAQWRTASAAAT
ncbi:MAG: PqiC family protein [Pseudomonadota bacterium]